MYGEKVRREFHKNVQVSELIYNSSVRTQDVVWRTCREWWIIETNGERVLAAWHSDIHLLSVTIILPGNGICESRLEFKIWMWLFAFDFTLMVSSQPWVNSRVDCVLEPWLGDQLRRRKTLKSNQLYSLKKLTLSHVLLITKALGKYIYIYTHTRTTKKRIKHQRPMRVK